MSDKNDAQPAGAPSPIGEISQEPSKFEAFLDANQKKLVLLGIIAILGLIAYVVYDGLREKGAREDAAVVSAARTVPELEAAAKELDGSNAGGSALILKAEKQWDDQQQQQAISTLEDFISKYPEHPALGNALASLGSYYQVKFEKDKAIEAFKKSAELKTSASSLALLSLGDIALSEGDGEAAKGYYDRIITEFESHLQVKGLAQQRLKLIGVKAPTEKAPEPPKPTPGAPNQGAVSKPIQIPAPAKPIIPAEPVTPAPATSSTPEVKNDADDLGALPELELPTPPKTEDPTETSPAE